MAAEFNFAVSPVIPENQIDKEKTYFDLKMAAGAEQTIEVQLRNDTDKDLTVEAVINSATTNLNGVVEYGDNKIKADKSLKYNLEEYVAVEKEIKIPKNAQINVAIKLKMPKAKFDGVLAGGITFKEKTTADQTTSSSEDEKGLAITNEYSYVVALLMRQNQTTVTPNLKVTNVAAGQVNARNVINVALQNPKASYLNQLKVTSQITKKGQKKVLYEAASEGLQMAPNSHFDYPISLEGEKLAAGDYQLNLVAYGGKSENGTYTVKNSEGKEESYTYKWVFKKDFTIKRKVAKNLNEKDVSIEENHLWIYLLIGILALLLIVFLVLLLFKRKKNKKLEAH